MPNNDTCSIYSNSDIELIYTDKDYNTSGYTDRDQSSSFFPKQTNIDEQTNEAYLGGLLIQQGGDSQNSFDIASTLYPTASIEQSEFDSPLTRSGWILLAIVHLCVVCGIYLNINCDGGF